MTNYIDIISDQLLDNLYIDHLPHYPRDSNNLELFTDLPCRITKGSDMFWYPTKSNEYMASELHLWYVCFDDAYSDILIQGFETSEEAYTYAVTEYIEYLSYEIDKVNKIKDSIS